MKSATITINKDIVLKDIDAQTFKRADGALSGESDQLRNAVSSDSSENLDKNLLFRFMESRDADVRAKLAFCLTEQDEVLSATNEIDIYDGEFVYLLSVPDTFNKQKLQILATRIHDYIVNGTLYDWYATQNMRAGVTLDELKEMENKISFMLRSSYVKRPLQPFGPRN